MGGFPVALPAFAADAGDLWITPGLAPASGVSLASRYLPAVHPVPAAVLRAQTGSGTPGVEHTAGLDPATGSRGAPGIPG